MECEHGWRNASDCDACTRARVMPSAEAYIIELEKAAAQMRPALTEIRDAAATRENGGAWAAGIAVLGLGTLPKSVTK